jgi:hypothetical protein
MPTVSVNLPLAESFGKEYIFAQINGTEYTISVMEKFLKKFQILMLGPFTTNISTLSEFQCTRLKKRKILYSKFKD